MGCTRAVSATWPGGTRVRGSGSRLVVRLTLATYSAGMQAASGWVRRERRGVAERGIRPRLRAREPARQADGAERWQPRRDGHACSSARRRWTGGARACRDGGDDLAVAKAGQGEVVLNDAAVAVHLRVFRDQGARPCGFGCGARVGVGAEGVQGVEHAAGVGSCRGGLTMS